MKLEGPRVGFHRKIREPTINRPGLALTGSIPTSPTNVCRCWARTSFPTSDVSRGSARNPITQIIRAQDPVCGSRGGCVRRQSWWQARRKIALFQTPMVTMKFINARHLNWRSMFPPPVTEIGSMVDILGVGVIHGASGIGKSEACSP